MFLFEMHKTRITIMRSNSTVTIQSVKISFSITYTWKTVKISNVNKKNNYSEKTPISLYYNEGNASKGPSKITAGGGGGEFHIAWITRQRTDYHSFRLYLHEWFKKKKCQFFMLMRRLESPNEGVLQVYTRDFWTAYELRILKLRSKN